MKTVFILLAGTLLSMCAYGPSASAEAVVIRLHVIPLRDQEVDALGRPRHDVSVTPAQFAALIERVNWIYEGTGIQFTFDPGAGWQPMADTQMNSDQTLAARGNQLAGQHQGKLLCFLRWGPNSVNPTGNGNAYPPPGAGPIPSHVNGVTQDYVALPSFLSGFGGLNQGNGNFVAHEFGHYLGLHHTFPGWDDRTGPVYGSIPPGTPTQAQADQAVIAYIGSRGGTIEGGLDGDGLSDTAPDPSPILYAARGQMICNQRSIVVSGMTGGIQRSFTLRPDPNSVMGYHAACPAGSTPAPARFTHQQIHRMHETLQHTSRNHLLRPPTTPECTQLQSDIRRLEGEQEQLAALMATASTAVKADLGRRINQLESEIQSLHNRARALRCPGI